MRSEQATDEITASVDVLSTSFYSQCKSNKMNQKKIKGQFNSIQKSALIASNRFELLPVIPSQIKLFVIRREYITCSGIFDCST